MLEFFALMVLGVIALWIFVILPTMRKDQKDNEQKKQHALENQGTIFREFFDGTPSKIWKATDNYMPAENMISGGINHGYRTASREGAGLSTTIVFERVG